LGKKQRKKRAKEARGQVLRLCLESLVVMLMLAFVFGGVVTLGRHTVATDTYPVIHKQRGASWHTSIPRVGLIGHRRLMTCVRCWAHPRVRTSR
jgi:hypothetical protein